MTLWEFAACVAGHARANGAEDTPPAPSGDELDAAILDFHMNAPKEWTH